jgi:hypothetical protein
MNIWVEHIPNTTFDWNSEKNAFKRATSKVRQFKSNATGEKFIEYYVGVIRFDMLLLFPFILNTLLYIVIRKVMGNSMASLNILR